MNGTLDVVNVEANEREKEIVEKWNKGNLMFVGGIRMLAEALCAAEEIGFQLDTGVFDNWTLDCLRRIGKGMVLPNVILARLEQPTLMKKVAQYPLNQQKQIIENEPLDVLVPGKPGGERWDVAQMRPNEMTPVIQKQVFDKNTIRTTAAQRAYNETPELSRALAVKVSEKTIVFRNGVFIINPHKEVLKMPLKKMMELASA